MTLIKSISGIRGTIGGQPGDALTPQDIVKYSTAFAALIKESGATPKVVVGRDARLSGPMVHALVAHTLTACGIDVIDLGLSTTPTVEMAVVEHGAGGGIIITASHNPIQWNALKLLNHKGEFISADAGARVLMLAENENTEYAHVKALGKITEDTTALQKHIDAILALPLVNKEAIKAKNFKIVLDAVNSSGGTAVPALLEQLGVNIIEKLNCEPTGLFAHNPEPLPEHLGQISGVMEKGSFDLGIVVDPDVDRLALVCEDGSMFGEEYTLVAIADYVLKHTPGNTVSNLSSTRALAEVTEKCGMNYTPSAVGEVNVVEAMKRTKAVIGGEGNGGVIYPELHYGRDALVGIALFLSHLATCGKTTRALKATYPSYHISKNKIELQQGMDVDGILNDIKEKYRRYPVNVVDGVRIDFEQEWVHLRKSNTEPIIRIYAESHSEVTANNLALKMISDIKEIITVK